MIAAEGRGSRIDRQFEFVNRLSLWHCVERLQHIKPTERRDLRLSHRPCSCLLVGSELAVLQYVDFGNVCDTALHAVAGDLGFCDMFAESTFTAKQVVFTLCEVDFGGTVVPSS